MDEVWKEIPLHPWRDLYEASNLGRVRRKPTIMKLRNIKGYDVVNLKHKGRSYTVGAHRLVAAAFHRTPNLDECVNHLNANRRDNRPENLEWTTLGDNCRHTAALGRTASGLNNGNGKIEPLIALQMRQEGATLKQIADRFGATPTAALRLIKRWSTKYVINGPADPD